MKQGFNYEIKQPKEEGEERPSVKSSCQINWGGKVAVGLMRAMKTGRMKCCLGFLSINNGMPFYKQW